jgi:hypothetical protein
MRRYVGQGIELLFVLADSAFLSEQASSRTLFDNLSEQESCEISKLPPARPRRTQSKESKAIRRRSEKAAGKKKEAKTIARLGVPAK